MSSDRSVVRTRQSVRNRIAGLSVKTKRSRKTGGPHEWMRETRV
jgi:hypothetical protein